MLRSPTASFQNQQAESSLVAVSRKIWRDSATGSSGSYTCRQLVTYGHGEPSPHRSRDTFTFYSRGQVSAMRPRNAGQNLIDAHHGSFLRTAYVASLWIAGLSSRSSRGTDMQVDVSAKVISLPRLRIRVATSRQGQAEAQMLLWP